MTASGLRGPTSHRAAWEGQGTGGEQRADGACAVSHWEGVFYVAKGLPKPLQTNALSKKC